jgi:hypothetical protein
MMWLPDSSSWLAQLKVRPHWNPVCTLATVREYVLPIETQIDRLTRAHRCKWSVRVVQNLFEALVSRGGRRIICVVGHHAENKKAPRLPSRIQPAGFRVRQTGGFRGFRPHSYGNGFTAALAARHWSLPQLITTAMQREVAVFYEA